MPNWTGQRHYRHPSPNSCSSYFGGGPARGTRRVRGGVCVPFFLSLYFPSICLSQEIPSQPRGYVAFVSPTQLVLSHVLDEADGTGAYAYRARSGLLVAALASDLEGNIVGGVALDLDGSGSEVVEVLVEQLEEQTCRLAMISHTTTRQGELASPQLPLTEEKLERSRWSI